MAWVIYPIIAVMAYLLGAIPTGYLVARARGVDIRTVGSGNIGATNVFRMLGKGAGTFVLLADALKGWLACEGAVWTIAALGLNSVRGLGDHENIMYVAGAAAILGHIYTCWLNFKGGKGIATTAGVGLAWAANGLLIALGSWIIVTLVTRHVSAGSIAAAIMLPIGVWISGGSATMIGVTATIGVLAIFKHRGNIRRLIAGTEPRLSFGRSKEEGKP